MKRKSWGLILLMDAPNSFNCMRPLKRYVFLAIEAIDKKKETIQIKANKNYYFLFLHFANYIYAVSCTKLPYKNLTKLQHYFPNFVKVLLGIMVLNGFMGLLCLLNKMFLTWGLILVSFAVFGNSSESPNKNACNPFEIQVQLFRLS